MTRARDNFQIIAMTALLAVILSCSGDGEGVTANGTGPAKAKPGVPTFSSPLADSLFSQVQTTVFSAVCTDCHSGGSAPMGLQLTPSDAAALVGRSSEGRPDLLLVTPGDPDNSYLIHKIEGRNGIIGKQMPRDMPALTSVQISLVKSWITALGSGAPVDTSKPGNTGVTPPPGGGTNPPVDTAGTGGGNIPTVDTTKPPIAPPPGTPLSDSLFRRVQMEIFTPICSDCHVGSYAPSGLQLSAGISHTVIGKASEGKPDMALVKPGKPDESYIIWKVEGRAGIVGERMPRDMPVLSAANIQLMKDWIASLNENATPGPVVDTTFVPPVDTLVPGSTEALFQDARNMVFGPICSQCHIGRDAPEDLRLDGDYPLRAIGRRSDEKKDVLLIKAGDPDNSYLVWKIEGRRGSGDRMPLDMPPLKPEQILAVRKWIESLQ